ncbi:MAG: glycosyltransferase family 2 protein [Planctomycetaceae bacterium]|nr:glycosyltransferase family 2 protein [Planctomycetaceae bacterium]
MPSAPASADSSVPSIDPMVAEGTWVVVPVYNEATAIGGVVAELRRTFPNVVCVDDGSTDGSWKAVLSATPHALRHMVNRGQGAAIQTGTDYALRRGAQRIAHFDADGQHRVEDLVTLTEAVASGTCDIALGDRFSGDAAAVPAARRALLRAAVAFHRLTSGIALNDVHNGLRVLSRRAAERIEITADRMAHASEIIDLIAESGLVYRELPVRIRYTDYSRAKGQSWAGGFRIIFHYLVGRILG